MKKTLITNIGRLTGIVPEGILRKEGKEMGKVESLEDAWLLINGEEIEAFGQGDPDTEKIPGLKEHKGVLDAGGGIVMPSFCDSHSHIVYAGSRYGEFIDKINGLTYEQIAARGGGILNSADLLHETSEEELFRQSLERAKEVMAMGTGSLEIKSGSGLNTEDELKMLRVIRRLKATLPLEIRATFLGAHAVGRAYTGRQGEYVDMVCREMLPAVAAEGLADFVDVFCDSGFFTPEETMQILDAAQVYGLRGKIHANELAVSGGVQAGVSRGALSVDHLERTTEAEINALNTVFAFPPPLASAKGGCGHTLGAAGIIQACMAFHILDTGILFPQTNLLEPEPAAAGMISGKMQAVKIPRILSMNSGFGGLNAVLMIEALTPS